MRPTVSVLLIAALSAAVFLMPGCIPSTPDKPAGETGVQDKPATKVESVVESGIVKSTLQMEKDPKPNFSVELSPLPEGKGYAIRGTFNLLGHLTPAGEGKWRLKAEYRMAEADFRAGEPVISSVNNVFPGADGVVVAEDALLVMVDLPVHPPASRAPEGTELHVIPVEAVIDAPKSAQFNIFFTTIP